MISVRPAVLDDMPWLLTELAAFDEFFGSSRSLFPDTETAQQTLATLIEGQPFFMAEDVNGPVGFIAGILAPHFLNGSILQLTELFWWVQMESRGSRAGAVLFRAFEEFGRKNADWIVMTLEAESPVDPASLLKRGYRAKETSYLLEVC